MARLAAGGHRVLGWANGEKEIEMISSGSGSGSGSGGEKEIEMMNIADHVFGFLDEESSGSSSSFESNSHHDQDGVENPWDDDDEEDGGGGGGGGSLSSSLSAADVENNKNFWETQNQLLQATLYRTSSLESKIRNIVRQAVKQAAQEEEEQGQMMICCCCCCCTSGGCRNSCLMNEICNRLHNSGFNAAICNSKWKTTPNIASGEHTFVDVVEERSTTSKRTTTRVIIELNLRGEFEMGRASDEYKAVMNIVPQVYVGKADRFLSLIKILSTCAKKSFKDQHMHLGPWRRHKYFQAKWFQVSLRTIPLHLAPCLPPPLSTTTTSQHLVGGRPRRRSMLTVDLLDNFSCSTIAAGAAAAAAAVHTSFVAVL